MEEESQEAREMAEVEVIPPVNCQEVAFQVAWRLKEDAFPLEDGRVAVVEADDTTLRENVLQNL